MASAKVKYDLRYGDEDDSDEILAFVNQQHVCEFDEKSPSFFRAEGPRISLEEVCTLIFTLSASFRINVPHSLPY